MPAILRPASSHHLPAKRQEFNRKTWQIAKRNSVQHTHTKVYTLIGFTGLHSTCGTEALISHNTKCKQISGRRVSDPPNGQPNWLVLSHLGGLHSSVVLPLKERKLACSGAERARCPPAFCRCHVPTNRALWRHDNQPSLVLLSYSDQSVGSRLISCLDFTFNPFLHI